MGLREPITLYEGKVIDGKHRYRACVELGIEPHTRELSGAGTPLEYIISENVKRRHLTVGQRAALAVELRPLIDRDIDAPPNSRRATPSKRASVKAAAEYVKVHPASVEVYQSMATTAPDLAKEVRSGEKPLWSAHAEMQAREPKPRRKTRAPTDTQLSNRARESGQQFAKAVAALTNARGSLTMMELWSIWAAIFEVQGYLEQIARKHQVAVPESPGDLKRLKPGS